MGIIMSMDRRTHSHAKLLAGLLGASLCGIPFLASAAPSSVEVLAAIADVAATCAAEPLRPGGTTYYYCDCGTGAQPGCIAGDDANPGTSPSAPRRTIADAASRFRSSLAVNDTVALCQGGAFNATGNLYIGSSRCGNGGPCNDLREYGSPVFAATAKPIINSAAGGTNLFFFQHGDGGVRFLNLRLQGDNGAIGNANRGFFFYNNAHDITACNLDIDGFDMAVYNESNNGNTQRIKVVGNRITNTRTIGFLGGGDDFELSYNYWDGNGSSNMFDHTLYFGSGAPLYRISAVGNYIHGQYGSACLGAPVVAHAQIDGLLFKDNFVVVEAAEARPGCWGIAFNNRTGATHPQYYRHAVFSGNTVINGGNNGLTISSCPGCVIEDNLVIQDWPVGGSVGISVPNYAQDVARGDDLNTANIIRNNTVWFGPSVTGTSTGIVVAIEGNNHVVANNTVSSRQTSGTVNCFRNDLPLSSYAFIDNNHCHSAATSLQWEYSHGSLDAWRSFAAASGFDQSSFVGDPLLAANGTDFVPPAGSPLVGAGNASRGALADYRGKSRPNPPAIGAFEPGVWSIPSVPTLTRIVSGNGNLKVFFLAPAADGGQAILDYTVRCAGSRGTVAKVATTSPIVVEPLVSGATYGCSVRARNGKGSGPETPPVTKVARRTASAAVWSTLLDEH